MVHSQAVEDSTRRLSALTLREREVVELVAKGLTNADIARILGFTPRTAKAHVENALRKLHAANRAEAAAIVIAEQSQAPERDMPAIAVLPLTVDTADHAERVRADAFIDDLITTLGRRWFPVIGRCSSFAVDPRGALDLAAAGKRLEATYLVEGSLLPSANRLKLNMRLIEAATSRVVWTDSFVCDKAELTEVPSALAATLVSSLSNATIQHVAQASAHRPESQLRPWELAAHGMWALWRGTRSDSMRAKQLFGQALREAPRERLAHYGLTLSHQRDIVEQWVDDMPQALATLTASSERFANLHPEDPWAHLMQAYTAIYDGRRDEAIEHVLYTVGREPSSVRGRSLSGQLLAMAGASDAAIVELQQALRLSPLSPDRWTREASIALAHFAAADYESAITWAKRSTCSGKASVIPYGVLASSYAQLGHLDEARASMKTLTERNPSFSDSRFGTMLASTEKEIAERYLDGLRKAAS